MRARILAAAALLLALAACAKHHPMAPAAPIDTGPVANSPANAVHRLAWGLVHRDTVAYDGVLTDDYLFVFAQNDSAGNPYRTEPWDVTCERLFARHLFVGGAGLPQASDISLVLDNLLLTAPDPRPDRTWPYHKTIRTHVDLKVTVTDASGIPSVTPISGYALFFLVRGDSAALSPARAAGGGSDSTHWYIERWEDQTVGAYAPGMHVDPTSNRTLGSIKVLYR